MCLRKNVEVLVLAVIYRSSTVVEGSQWLEVIISSCLWMDMELYHELCSTTLSTLSVPKTYTQNDLCDTTDDMVELAKL